MNASTHASPSPFFRANHVLRETMNQLAQQWLTDIRHSLANGQSTEDSLQALLQAGRSEMQEAGRLCRALQAHLLPTAADSCILDIQNFLQDCHPARFGQLQGRHMLLGFIPLYRRLPIYLRRLAEKSQQLMARLDQFALVQDEWERSSIALEDFQAGLDKLSHQLAGKCALLETILAGLQAEIQARRANHAEQAQYLEQEILIMAQQHLDNLQTQQAICHQALLHSSALQASSLLMQKSLENLRMQAMAALAMAHWLAEDKEFDLLPLLRQHSSNLTQVASRALTQTQRELAIDGQHGNQGYSLEKMQAAFDHALQECVLLTQTYAQAGQAMPQLHCGQCLH